MGSFCCDTSHMVRRWRQANRIIEAAEAERRAAGIPDPKWYEEPFLAAVTSFAGVGLVVWVAGLIFNAVGAVTFGIILVVLLGATGYMLRGVGEQRHNPRLKAWGYYIGAQAYMATASVALLNGVPRLLVG